MWGTLNSSRWMLMPGRPGIRSSRVAPGARPSASDLKKRVRSLWVTRLNSGVSPSYILAWRSAPGGGGTLPYWPAGRTFSAVSA